ncbi:ABC transporter permease [Clostridium sp. M62/1]|uniref:ABC transporter permease n=1 Tax=Clostridium sp. M62/1 TaxID=411486 RepID=UPI003564E14C
MTNYIIRRTALAVITFFGITILVYFMSTLAPGSPLDALLADPGMTKEEIARRSAELGLDQPVYIQYLSWLKEFLHGNMGFSYTSYRPVSDMITERIGATLSLTVTAILLSYLVGIPLGLISALKPYSLRDYSVSTAAFVMTGVPGFFLGMILIYIFAVKLKLLPFGGMYDSSGSNSIGVVIRHLILPAAAIAIPEIGKVMRHVRSNMLEVMNEDYVRTARAKGVGESAVVIVHAFRNTLIPIVTVLSGSIPFMIGGSVVVEKVFGWPGLGTLMINSITSRDYPVIMGISVVIAIVVLVTNLLVDILYAYLDPRITYN